MNTSRRWLWPFLLLLGLVALFALAAVAINAVRPPKRFSIASGATDGVYYAAATRLSKQLAAQGWQADVLVTAGSAENLSLLKSGKADFAIVQGGVAQITDTAGLSTVAMVSYEPVWLLVRRAAFDKAVAELLPADLEGRRIGIGAPGSGIHPVARQILAGIGISETNAILAEEGMSAMADGLRNGQLDAAFFVTTAANPAIRDLVRDPAIGLYEARFADALSRKLTYLNPVTLYRGTFDMDAIIPAEDVPMVAARTALVARQGVHPDLVRLMLTMLPSTLPNPPLVGARDEFPSLAGVEIPANLDALEYFRSGTTPFERYLPFEIASPLSRFYLLLLPLAVLAVPAWSLAMATYRWYMNSRVLNWYPEITAIDRELPRYTIEQVDEKIAFLHNLDAEIGRRVKVNKGNLPAYFDLRNHMRYVLGRLQERRAELVAPVVATSVAKS